MSVNLRKAIYRDVKGISELWVKLSIDQLSKDKYYKRKLEFEHVENQFINAIENKNCAIYVAVKGDKIIAFIEVWLYNKETLFPISDYGYILHMFCEPSERNYLIVVDLYKMAEKWVISNGRKYLITDVFYHNPKVLQILKHLGSNLYITKYVKRLTDD